MKEKPAIRRILIFTVLFAVVASGCGAAKNRYSAKAGIAIPSGIAETKLADILKSPKSYQDKKVLLSGTIEYICPSLCDLTFRQVNDTMKVFPFDYVLPNSKKGQPVRVYGDVKLSENGVFISALGVEVKK